MQLRTQGILFILSSPSGVGKTTLAELLIKKDKNLTRSISVTTRQPRFSEVDGADYFFVTEKQFLDFCHKQDMLEHAIVFGNYYGTLKHTIITALSKGRDVLCCIDWQGAIQIKQRMKAVSIFLLPPSLKELERRLRSRGTDDEVIIQVRLKEAKEEIPKYLSYNYVIINDHLYTTLEKIQAILEAERYNISHQGNLPKFINEMLI